MDTYKCSCYYIYISAYVINKINNDSWLVIMQHYMLVVCLLDCYLLCHSLNTKLNTVKPEKSPVRDKPGSVDDPGVKQP